MSRKTNNSGPLGIINTPNGNFTNATIPYKYNRYPEVYCRLSKDVPKILRILRSAGRHIRKYNKPSI